jgi:3-carboxy-cis,cis-muconate cycloisomerase
VSSSSLRLLHGTRGGWLALVTATLGKIGQDLILLAQTEVAEVFEQPDAGRGSSSTMPHKSNPIASEMMVVAARAVGAFQSALLAASIQEHERSTHGWQLEWLVLPQMVALTHGAATGGASVLGRLHVDTARMLANVALAGDVALGESLVFALARRIGLLEAQALVKEAAARRRRDNESLVAVVRRLAAKRHIDEIDWPELTASAGSANRFIDSIVAEAKRIIG